MRFDFKKKCYRLNGCYWSESKGLWFNLKVQLTYICREGNAHLQIMLIVPTVATSILNKKRLTKPKTGSYFCIPHFICTGPEMSPQPS